MKVAVFGARGRMGQEACRALEAEQDLDLVARIDIEDSKQDAGGAEVVVDFTHPDAVLDNLSWCVDHQVSMVIGTSGFTPERIQAAQEILGSSARTLGVLIVPNFSIGAVLMMHFSTLAAPYFEAIEIIEAHHTAKVDAPSGTAVNTARLMAQARESLPPMPDATTHEAPGARGTQASGMRIHSIRLPGLIAQQEVRLGSGGENLTIVHDARSRACYGPGIVKAVRWIGSHPGLTVGLDAVLGLGERS